MVALAPTWKSNAVVRQDRLAVERSCRRCRADLRLQLAEFVLQRSASLALLVALADCTASSRMRCSMSPILPSALSAVCAIEMPSLALRTRRSCRAPARSCARRSPGRAIKKSRAVPKVSNFLYEL